MNAVFESKNVSQTEQELQTDLQKGLSQQEAKNRLEKNGPNALVEKKGKTKLQMFLSQLNEPMIYILFAAAAISLLLKEVSDAIIVLIVVLLNAVIGMVQEGKAQEALEALKKLSSPTAMVRRDGVTKEIPASELVQGDVVVLEAGRQIPADLRLTQTTNLKVDESALTGESVPVEKDCNAVLPQDAPLGDRINMGYMTTSVTYGRGEGVVAATGMDTQIGRIAQMINESEEELTPLQKRLADLGKMLGVVAIALCVALFLIALVQGRNVVEMLITAISLAVAAVPEGLPAVVTIVLALGVQRLVKVNTIVRRLPSVETLGAVSVVCSDKTGTLTQNKMTVVRAYCDGAIFPADQMDSKAHRRLVEGMMLCNDASIENGQRLGDPTEIALLDMGAPLGLTRQGLEEKLPRIDEIAFDSTRKMMTTMHREGEGNISFTKGAPDQVLKHCDRILDRGTVREITPADKEKITSAMREMSMDALRVLALAFRDDAPQVCEERLTFVGLVGMIDPPRPEVKDAVAVCRKAGIKPVMITGDHVVTAAAIARELGILQPGDKAITGAELDAMTDGQLDQEVEHISVYARVSPENKIRIVRAWQRKGQVVSMTGDGVNDAPALKAADIGCAMGITGTDVAKGAADMTLTDDNFSTIVDAVREGRGIYANIRKVVGFLLGTNIGEVITVFTAMLLWHKTPLLSMQLLWINLVTDSMPAIALGMEAVESDIMDQKPRPRDEGIFAHGLGLRVILQGVMFAVLTLIGFVIGENATGTLSGGQTMAFLVLSLSQIVQAYNMRSDHSLFRIGPFSNRNLNLACLASFLLVALVLFTPVRTAFGLVVLPARTYLTGFALTLVPIVVMELSKAFGLIKHQH